MKETVIFDLDGTLANIEKRRVKSLTKMGRIHWPAFFDPEKIHLDEPHEDVIRMYTIMKNAGFRVGIFSGRDEITKEKTLEWLSKYGIEPEFLYMRPHDTKIPDEQLKKAWLQMELNEGHTIFCVFDDRNKVVEMWRENGIRCFQVETGNF